MKHWSETPKYFAFCADHAFTGDNTSYDLACKASYPHLDCIDYGILPILEVKNEHGKEKYATNS